MPKLDGKNVDRSIGTGRFREREGKAITRWRECGRELVSAYAPRDRGCSMPVGPFSAACRFHITDAEKDAAILARQAFRMGVEWSRRRGLDAEVDFHAKEWWSPRTS